VNVHGEIGIVERVVVTKAARVVVGLEDDSNMYKDSVVIIDVID
jgi:hypothetical protein